MTDLNRIIAICMRVDYKMIGEAVRMNVMDMLVESILDLEWLPTLAEKVCLYGSFTKYTFAGKFLNSVNNILKITLKATWILTGKVL